MNSSLAGLPSASAQKEPATVKTEYAASGRGKCASCAENIARVIMLFVVDI